MQVEEQQDEQVSDVAVQDEQPEQDDPRRTMALALGVPEEALPQGPSKGQSNYTIHCSLGAIVEVQLTKKAFWMKKSRGGLAYNQSPKGFAWSKHGGVVECWAKVVEMVGWQGWQDV